MNSVPSDKYFFKNDLEISYLWQSETTTMIFFIELLEIDNGKIRFRPVEAFGAELDSTNCV